MVPPEPHVTWYRDNVNDKAPPGNDDTRNCDQSYRRTYAPTHEKKTFHRTKTFISKENLNTRRHNMCIHTHLSTQSLTHSHSHFRVCTCIHTHSCTGSMHAYTSDLATASVNTTRAEWHIHVDSCAHTSQHAHPQQRHKHTHNRGRESKGKTPELQGEGSASIQVWTKQRHKQTLDRAPFFCLPDALVPSSLPPPGCAFFSGLLLDSACCW